jgi:hypothetical protein
MIATNESLGVANPACKSAIPGTLECEAFDGVEAALAKEVQLNLPVTHRFTPGLYIREIFMPASVPPIETVVTSRIHLTEHPFTISKGRLKVWQEESGWVTLEAPYTGITKAGTRRILIILEDTIWTTYHLNPTDEIDPDKILDLITLDHFAHLGGIKDFKVNTDSTQIFIQEGRIIPDTVDRTNTNRVNRLLGGAS